MITKIRKVYYCEYCGKHSLRPLRKHERYCTANPNRHCRLCGRQGYEKLIEKYKNIGISKDYSREDFKKFQEKINELYAEVDNCPACTLTVIRCVIPTKIQPLIEWSYDKAREQWWNDVNTNNRKYGFYD